MLLRHTRKSSCSANGCPKSGDRCTQRDWARSPGWNMSLEPHSSGTDHFAHRPKYESVSETRWALKVYTFWETPPFWAFPSMKHCVLTVGTRERSLRGSCRERRGEEGDGCAPHLCLPFFQRKDRPNVHQLWEGAPPLPVVSHLSFLFCT